MQITEVIECLEFLNLHEEVGIFDTLDIDRTGELTFDEFFEGMMLIMKGGEVAKARDIVGTYLTCQSLQGQISRLTEIVNQALSATPADPSKEFQALHEQSSPHSTNFTFNPDPPDASVADEHREVGAPQQVRAGWAVALDLPSGTREALVKHGVTAQTAD